MENVGFYVRVDGDKTWKLQRQRQHPIFDDSNSSTMDYNKVFCTNKSLLAVTLCFAAHYALEVFLGDILTLVIFL